ncbi:hypothetical protein KR009_002719 [Drosophila setifemur]|nr:hypothetical protein KR009_002719 [Drosophila setifemur]
MLQNLRCPSQAVLYCGAAAIVTVLLMAWVRPLGVLFLGLLAFWIYYTRCSFRIVPTDECRSQLNSLLLRIEEVRPNRPGMLCLAGSLCCTIAVLGHLVSGSMIFVAILVITTLLSTKYNLKLLKIEHKDFQWSEKLNYNNLEAEEAEDEFLPDVNESNLFVLERASDVATISSPTEANEEDDDERSDDIPSELLIPDVIPEIDEHSTDEEDELAPLAKAKPKELASDRKPDESDIKFRKGHFKRDSSLSTSSSSEESLSKGLQFPDHTTVDAAVGRGTQLRQLTQGPEGPGSELTPTDAASELVALAMKSQAQALLANSGKLLPSLVSGLVQWGAGGTPAGELLATNHPTSDSSRQRLVTALDSSDESDFEILETDDFK